MERESLQFGPLFCLRVPFVNFVCHFDGNQSSKRTDSVHIMNYSRLLLAD